MNKILIVILNKELPFAADILRALFLKELHVETFLSNSREKFVETM